MNKVFVCDFVSRNGGHAVFNANIIWHLIKTCSGEIKAFLYSSNHIVQAVCPSLEGSIVYIEDRSWYILRSFKMFRKITKMGGENDNLVVLATDSIFIPALFIIYYQSANKFKRSISLILHSNYSALNGSRIKRYVFSQFVELYQARCIVLTEGFKKDYNKIVPLAMLHTFEHPLYDAFLRENMVRYFQMSKSKGVRILVTSSYAQDFHNFISESDLTNNLEIFLEQNELNILCVGDCDREKKIKGVNYLSHPENLTNYYEMIYNSDYVIVPVDERKKCRASGVAIDAISLNTKIIMGDTVFARDMELRFPDMCYVYDSPASFLEKLYGTLIMPDVKSDLLGDVMLRENADFNLLL